MRHVILAALVGLLAAATTPGLPGAAEIRAQQASASIDPGYGCLVCHAELRRAFVLGVHSERDVRCHDCHGGDPSALTADRAHSGDFLGPPDKVTTVRVCSRCHSDPNAMRQYGLPADQTAELMTSRHGQLLLEGGDVNAPTCTDCHDAHTTLRSDDARSGVYPPNISATCARCHENLDLMDSYGLPVGQTRAHRESAHGIALFERQNFAAPSCIGCHGSHAALPPDVAEITNVCGRCHLDIRQAFDRGPHGQAVRSGTLAGCTACHSNHGTERVPTEWIADTCTDCHEAASSAAALGVEMQEILLRAEEDMTAADEAIRELVRAGHEVADVRFRYRTAWNDFRQLAHTHHALDQEGMEDLSRRVASISRDIRTTAEIAAEERWEHKLILVPVWFFALSAVVLAGFKLRRGDSGTAAGRPGASE